MPRFSARMRRRQLDELLKGVALPTAKRGYLQEIRNALGMSSYQLAERMGVSQSTIKDLEDNERKKTITLRSLEKAAEALGCKLVYGLVPITSLDDVVRGQAKKKAAALASRVKRTMALEQQSAERSDSEAMISEIASDLLHRGGRDLWSKDGD